MSRHQRVLRHRNGIAGFRTFLPTPLTQFRYRSLVLSQCHNNTRSLPRYVNHPADHLVEVLPITVTMTTSTTTVISAGDQDMTEVIAEAGKVEEAEVEAEGGVEAVVRRLIDQWTPVGVGVEVKMTGVDQILVRNGPRDGGDILLSRLVAHCHKLSFSYHPFGYICHALYYTFS